MENLLQSQIKESCNLAIPNGLKELMADISREVLRAQPKDLCRFITDYLSVLLVTRANLSIASRVCCEVCDCSCQPELDDELRNIGLEPDDAETAKIVIMEYFNSGKVNEGKLLIKLMRKTDLDEELLPAVQEAVRAAFLRHQASHFVPLQTLSDKDMNEVSRAATHTMQLYKNVDTTGQEYHRMAEKIQVCADETGSSWNTHKISVGTISSTSLAGSYLKLPRYKPYSALDTNPVTELEEMSGREHAYIDYTEAIKRKKENVKIVIGGEEKRISFEEPHKEKEIDNDSESFVEEIIEVDRLNDKSVDEYDLLEEIEEIQLIDGIHVEMGSLDSIDSV